tara:strand:- start:8187 stop:8648 length:462 start_codon:yes stop_codon:yes gene_type:complete
MTYEQYKEYVDFFAKCNLRDRETERIDFHFDKEYMQRHFDCDPPPYDFIDVSMEASLFRILSEFFNNYNFIEPTKNPDLYPRQPRISDIKEHTLFPNCSSDDLEHLPDDLKSEYEKCDYKSNWNDQENVFWCFYQDCLDATAWIQAPKLACIY